MPEMPDFVPASGHPQETAGDWGVKPHAFEIIYQQLMSDPKSPIIPEERNLENRFGGRMVLVCMAGLGSCPDRFHPDDASAHVRHGLE
jgi:hypothetical protein